jgi:UDP-N-acetylmuramyl pentapeptide phosphotransferase/UDP-N-acetylglucosamine-1-phosphate transferase
MHALPSAIALLTAGVLSPVLIRALAGGGHTRPNYRGRELPVPLGILIPAAALLTLVPVMLIQSLAGVHLLYGDSGIVALYALGVLLLGLVDDMIGDAGSAPRGIRAHTSALFGGELSTGALKAVGSLGLALFALHYLRLSNGRWLLAAAVLVLATNAFNLLDLRPGRALKVFVVLGTALSAAAADLRTLWLLGLFAAPAVVAGGYDLRERGMLGDTGANLLGALAGLWLVFTLSGTGQAIALAALVIITVYGEFFSISELVERTPGLRELDSWGRPS